MYDHPIERAYAKINLTLDITGKRPDGYHELRSVMQTIGLYDTVEIKKAESGISLSVVFDEGEERGFSQVPTDERNIAYRAAKVLLEDANLRKFGGAEAFSRLNDESSESISRRSDEGEAGDKKNPVELAGVEIKLTKRIPAAAGLAGGSTDAAAVLRGINSLYGLGFTTEQLCEIGAKLGADVPFCIVGGTALCEGIGEKMTALPTPKGIHILLAKPAINVSTPEAYRDFDALSPGEIPAVDTDGMISILRGQSDIGSISRFMGNVLATVTERKHPLIVELREAMISAGAVGAMMSGSGPSVFGLFDTWIASLNASYKLKDAFPGVYITTSMFKEEDRKIEYSSEFIQENMKSGILF